MMRKVLLIALAGLSLVFTSGVALAGSANLTAAAVAKADVKVVRVYVVDAPDTIDVSQDVDITVKAILVSNGPYNEGVEVELQWSATAPPGSTATVAKCWTRIQQIMVPQPRSVRILKQTYTIHSSRASEHTFVFTPEIIRIKDPQVVDPNPNNNAASTSLTVNAIAEVDVKISGQQLVDPPSQIPVSQNVDVTLRKTLHNNGPYGPVDVDISASATAPADCTATADPANPTSANLPVSTDVVVDEVWAIHCDELSTHSFSFDNAITVITPHVEDPTPDNNSASTDLTVDAIAPADVKISGQELVDMPERMKVCEEVDVTLRKTLHNNGPYGPVDVDISASATAPADCTAMPDPANPTSANLPVSTDVVIDEVWTIHCDKPSTHVFSFNNAIAITTPHVEDPYPANNNTTTTDGLTVGTVGPADVKISGQELVDPPTEIDVSQDIDVTLRKTLHNNGPYGPVEVSISTFASPPADCTATPDPANPTSANLPVSTDVVIDEAWTIHCNSPSSHSFSFDNAVAIISPHVEDPDPTNNTASTDLTVDAITEADVKISGQQLVDPPLEIPVSEDVDVTLRKMLHNNGPYGPVDVDISASATAPADCAAIPDPANPSSANLPLSTDVVIDEVWAIHCDNRSSHSFSFDNAIAITTAHVSDPDGVNNAASTTLTVTALEYADLKIADQYVDSPPSEIDVSAEVVIDVVKVIHNNGPYGPVDAQVSKLASADSGCDVTPDSHTEFVPGIPVSVDIVLHELFTIQCSEPSTHSFYFDNEVAVLTGHVVDDVPANNKASTTLTVDAIAEADLKIVGQELVDPPTKIPVSEDVDVTLRKTLHNNGPYGPIDVDISASATAPGDCTAIPDPANPTSANLPVSTDVVIDEVWTIHCDEPSTHSFSFDNAIAITTPHVEDPTPDNDAAATELTVDAIAGADVKVVNEEIIGPSKINVSEDVDITVRATLHNNGPWGPVEVELGWIGPVAPTDCSSWIVNVPTQIELPVSVDVMADALYGIHCEKPSLHTFTAGTNINRIKDIHVVDPDLDNNSGSDDYSVEAWAEADLKIAGQELIDPPEKMKVCEEVDITLRKTIHNNGPYGPLEASIATRPVMPSDCTATPKNVPSSVTLPVSANVVVDEVWTIHCSVAGNRIFRFDNSILPPPHVEDTNPENNSASSAFAAIVALVRCPPWDRDCDGYYNYYEIMLGSDPNDKDSTPEHMSAPGTCTDGLDNDKDGLTDGADPACGA